MSFAITGEYKISQEFTRKQKSNRLWVLRAKGKNAKYEFIRPKSDHLRGNVYLKINWTQHEKCSK
jgi:hypothetical protein